MKISLIASFVAFLVFSGSIVIASPLEDIVEKRGKVLDSKTKEALVGVNIYLPELKKGVSTDIGGNFSLEVSDKEQSILLQVSFVGYKTQIFRIKTSDWPQPFILHLEEEGLYTSEVIISAGRIGSREEIPVLVDKMGVDEMRQDGEINAMTSLSKIPGVEQIAYGTGIGKPVIRGLSFSRILSMYQGTRFENQQWGADHGLGVNDLGIEAVEVIKGPASFLYGSGAVGGVVYMVDERPAARGTHKGYAGSSFHSNTLGLRSLAGWKETKEKGFFYSLDAALENHADYLDGDGRTIGNSRFNTQTVRSHFGWQKEKGSIKIGYSFHQQNLGIIEDDELEESLATERNDRKMQLPFQDMQDHLITANAIYQVKNGRLEASLGHHINFRKEIEDDLEEVDLGLIQRNTTFDIKYFYEVSDWQHIIGSQGFWLNNKNMDEVEEILIPDAQVLDASLYYLGTFRKAKTTYQFGLRYDARNTTADISAPLFLNYGFNLPGLQSDQRVYSTRHSGLSGSLGIIRSFAELWLLKTNLSSGFRAPDLAELFSNGEHPGTQRFEIGDINHKREQNYQWDLALSYQSKSWSMEVTPFVNLIDNYIYFSPTGIAIPNTDLTVWSFEQSDALLYGTEVQARWWPMQNKRLEINSAYSMVRGENLADGSNMPMIPADRIRTGMVSQLQNVGPFRDVRLSLNHLWVKRQERLSLTEIENFGESSTPAYQLIGAGLGGNLPLGKNSIRIDISASNLLNASYVDHLSFLRPFGIQNIGRNVAVHLMYRF
jgi:iron complex outermembrane recepter protein